MGNCISNDLTAELGTVEWASLEGGQRLINFFRNHPDTTIQTPGFQARQLDLSTHPEPSLLVGVGSAGYRAGQVYQTLLGQDLPLAEIDVYRIETDEGKELVAPDQSEMAALFHDHDGRVVFVDDTIYRGQTMTGLYERIPNEWRGRVGFIALKGTTKGRRRIEQHGPTDIGWVPDEVEPTICNASDFANPDGIHRKDKPDIPYYQRERWMREWFPDEHKKLRALCRDLHRRIAEQS